ncbi:hypothetical protein V502_01706 [Pseudogymnoascus sp. VKM F-4520 (FW-2644)]|nr:hypothetical protein V502_01706 [Pseudogymnoascus sp. VKM F-4520 (FW-2644)]
MSTELTGTLKKIKESGVITIGFRNSSIPLSFIVDGHRPTGFSNDLQLMVVKTLQKELKLPDLKIKYIPVTSATRIPLVHNGTVDLECGSTTNNLELNRIDVAPRHREQHSCYLGYYLFIL